MRTLMLADLGYANGDLCTGETFGWRFAGDEAITPVDQRRQIFLLAGRSTTAPLRRDPATLSGGPICAK